MIHFNTISTIMLVNVLPVTNAPKDKHTLVNMFRTARWKHLLSNKVHVSNAKDDMLVNEPQKPTATNSVCFGSKFKRGEKT